MDNPGPGSIRTLIVDLLIIALVIGLLYLETIGVFRFSVAFSMIIIGLGIISILLVNYAIQHSNNFKQTNSEKRIQLNKGYRLLGGGFLGFSILMFIFSYSFTQRNISGAICCAAPFFIIGVVFLGLERIRHINSLK